MEGGRVALALLFVPASVCWLAARVALFRTRSMFTPLAAPGVLDAGADGPPKGQHKGKVTTTPYDGSLEKTAELLGHVMRLLIVIGACIVADMQPLGAHGSRLYDRDMFLFLCVLLLVACWFTLKPGRGTAVLNRDQTEEWKGWMQFAFVAYHYYHAVEVYNYIRVFVSAYVWMTGFGNFSFFYTQADFSFVRMWRMLWRLNFSVFFLMLAMGNDYLLYYIVPLHTFYFLVVYLTMAIAPRLNRTKWGIRGKLAVLALIMYCLWEVPSWFDTAFRIIEVAPGGGLAKLHDWHFRTFLDHYSTIFGMVFALNFPMMTAWFNKVESLPPVSEWSAKLLVLAGLVGATAVWATTVLPLPKLQYNRVHPYFVVVPIITWIYIRNISATLRKYHLHGLATIGKITLETYLLQHHLLLTRNAKSLLTVLPGYPKCNLLVVTVGFVLLSHMLFRVTMELRFLLVPDDTGVAVRVCVAVLAYLVALVSCGAVLSGLGVHPAAVIALGVALGVASIVMYRAFHPRIVAFFTPHTTVKYTPVPEAATPGAGGGAVESHVATNGNGGDGAADTGAGAGVAGGVDAAANGQDDGEGTDVEAATGGDTGNGAAPAAAMPPPPRAPRTFVSGCKVAALVLVVAMVVTACIGGTAPADDAAASPSAAAAASPGMATGPRFHLTPFCRAELNHGGWRAEDGTQGCAWLPPPMRSAGPHPSPPPVYTATPRPYQWLWKPFGGSAARACGFHLYDGAAALSVLDGGKAVFIGDSHARRMFLYTARLMAAVQGTQSSPPDVASLNVNGHKDFAFRFTSRSGQRVSLEFLWRPYLSDAATAIAAIHSSRNGTANAVVVVSVGQWDLLHRPRQQFAASAAALATALGHTPVAGVEPAASDTTGPSTRRLSKHGRHGMCGDAAVFAVATLPTTVPAMMRDEEKQAKMAPADVDAGTAALRSAGVFDAPCALELNLAAITGDRSRVGMTSDGVHYTDIEYGVATQLALNSLSEPPPPPGSKYSVGGSLLWGAAALALLAAMLVFLDSYAGLLPASFRVSAATGCVVATECGGPVTWEDAYGKLHATLRQ